MPKSFNARTFPHFMERDRKKSYKSFKPLGRIYDFVNVENENFTPAYDKAFDNRILSRFELSDEELTKAREVKAKYDVAMLRLMGQHERPISEFEIWSTFILSKPRVGNDYKLQETVGRDVAALKERFRKLCGEAVTGVEQKTMAFFYRDIDLMKLDRFVAAMYTVTHDEVQAALNERSMSAFDEDVNKVADDQGTGFPMPLISFPWLFHHELVCVASGARRIGSKWKRYSNGAKAGQGSADGHGEDKAKAKTIPDEQKVMGKKEAEAEAEDDYVRTASGNVVHRGEMLALFDDNGGQVPNSVPTQASSSGQASAEPSPAETPQSCQSEHDDEDTGNFGAEEIEMVDSSDEDALAELARKIAAVGGGE